MLLWDLKAVNQLYSLLIDGQETSASIFAYLGFDLDVEKGIKFSLRSLL